MRRLQQQKPGMNYIKRTKTMRAQDTHKPKREKKIIIKRIKEIYCSNGMVEEEAVSRRNRTRNEADETRMK